MPAAVLQCFLEQVRRRPRAVAVREPGADFTFTELAAIVDSIAARLRSVGVREGDAVPFTAPNGMPFHAIDLAILTAGGVPACLPEHGSEAETERIMAQLDASVAVDFADGAFRLARGVRGRRRHDEPLTVAEARSGRHRFGEPAAPGHGVTAIVFSSGSTGSPQGIVLPARGILDGLKTWVSLWPAPEPWGRSVLGYLPLSHVAGRIMSHYLMCAYGATSVVANHRTLPADLVEHRPDILLAVPRTWDGLSRLVGARDAGPLRSALAGLELALNGGASLGADTVGRLAEHGIAVADAYGLTETSVPAFFQAEAAGDGALGVPVGVEHRIAPDGTLRVRSPYRAMGTVTRWPEFSPVADEDGWLDTGDLVAADGPRLRLRGRIGAGFKTAKGKHVEPEPIEAHLDALPDVEASCLVNREGRDAVAVLSIPDSRDWSTAQIADRKSQIGLGVRAALAEGRIPFVDLAGVVIAADTWDQASELVTRNGKIRRDRVGSVYAEAIRNANLGGSDGGG